VFAVLVTLRKLGGSGTYRELLKPGVLRPFAEHGQHLQLTQTRTVRKADRRMCSANARVVRCGVVRCGAAQLSNQSQSTK
jgi:hypothetical protein